MVRQISLPDDYDFEANTESLQAVSIRKQEQDAEQPSIRVDLAQAFLRFRKTHKRLGFKRLLSLWVSHRRKLKLPVDDLDPEETSPSEPFVRFLKARFDEAAPR